MEEQTKKMPRGLIPSPEEALRTARVYVPRTLMAMPSSFLQWPYKMSYWGNDKYGDCVTAEEAFAKVTASGHYFIPECTVIGWAERNGYLNGTTCSSVLSTMRDKGIDFSMNILYDGNFSIINYKDCTALRNAIYCCGPVKLSIDSKYMQPVTSPAKGNMTPGESGWALYNYPQSGKHDHCVSVCGYGLLDDLISEFKKYQIDVRKSSGMPGGMWYAVFTWNSIGIVDEQSLLNMTYEAWARDPVTRTVSLPKVSAFRLKNDGGFVVDIHAIYHSNDPNNPYDEEVANKKNFPIAQTREMKLAEKCVKGKNGKPKHSIQAGDSVQLKVWVSCGKDNTSSLSFIYDPNGPIQSFKISGATLNNSLEYLGAC